MNWRVFLALVLVLGLTSSCVPATIEGSGSITTEARDVAGVRAVSIRGIGDLVIRQTGSESLTVTADDNILEYIRTEVRNGVLTIDVDARTPGLMLRPSAEPVYELEVIGITGIAISGSGSASADTLEGDLLSLAVSGSGDIRLGALDVGELTVAISGSGDIVLAGEVPSQSVAVSGSGRYRAGKLMSSSARVSVSGSGDITIWATDDLDVGVSGSGSVGYYGDPSVTRRVSGTGRVRALGAGVTTL